MNNQLMNITTGDSFCWTTLPEWIIVTHWR